MPISHNGHGGRHWTFLSLKVAHEAGLRLGGRIHSGRFGCGCFGCGFIVEIIQSNRSRLAV